MLHLVAGQLDLLNVTFLDPDGDLSTGDLIIGLPVLRHLRVDTRTLLERIRATLDGTDCGEVQGITDDRHKQQVGRLVNVTYEKGARTPRNFSNRPHSNYYTSRVDEDEFPDPSRL